MPKFYTVNEVSKLLRFSEKTIRDMIVAGEIPANKIGRQWRVSETDLQNYLDKNKNTFSEGDN